MKNQLLEELTSSHSLYSLYLPPKRNLGCAILAAAITDYQSMDDQVHASARRFLFPTCLEYQEHFDWAVALADGVNHKWLREALDESQGRWDLKRGIAQRKIESSQSALPVAEAECGKWQRTAAHG